MDNIVISKGIYNLDETIIKNLGIEYLKVNEIPYICLMVEEKGYKIFINFEEMEYNELCECLYKTKRKWEQIYINSSGNFKGENNYSVEVQGVESLETPEMFRFAINTLTTEQEKYYNICILTGHKIIGKLGQKETPEQTQQRNILFRKSLKQGEQLKKDEYSYELGKSFLNSVLGSLSQSKNKGTTKELLNQLTKEEKQIINPTINELKDEEIQELKEKLIPNLKQGKAPTQTRKELATYLELKYGVILRKNTGEIYKLDKTGYTFISLDDIIILLGQDLGKNVVSNKDIKEALESITTRLEPVYNIVKFPNCVYDIERGEIIEPEKPVFSLIESKYNYNPKAKSTKLKEFLYSSLARETPEKTKQTVRGLLQLIGYLFTSGNKYNFAPVLSGVSGGGKSLFIDLLTEIFGTDRTSDLSLQEMEKNTHGTSSLANKHLNFIKDSGNTIIEDNGTYKKLTGNEPIQINPKYKPPYMLPSEEVPKTVLTCNKIPKFRDYIGIIDRLVIIEFLVKFRNTEKENPNLKNEILENPQELEWLIYNSIQEYNKIKSKKDFILKLPNEETTKLLEKHTHPINYLLGLIIEEHNPNRFKEEEHPPIIAKELNKVLTHLAIIYGVELDLNKNNEIPPRKLLSAIKKEFDLYEGETVQDNNSNYIMREYITRPELVYNNETKKLDYLRCYPNLIAKPEYTEILNELGINKN